MILLLLPTLIVSASLETVEIGGHPLRMRWSEGVLIVIDTSGDLVTVLKDGKVTWRLEDVKGPVWAVYHRGYLYVTEIRRSMVSKWKGEKLIAKVHIPFPEMIRLINGKLFVSSRNEVFVLDENLRILKRYVFPSRSVYFEVRGRLLYHLEYWGRSPDLTVLDMESGMRKTYDFGLSRPFRLVFMREKMIILDYSGKLVVVGDGLKKYRLDPFSYGMAAFDGKVYVSSLVKNRLTVIDLKSGRIERIPLPGPAGDVRVCAGKVLAVSPFDDEIYVLEDGRVKRTGVCKDPLMIVCREGTAYVLCPESGKVCIMRDF